MGKEIAILGIFHDQVDDFLVLDDIPQLDDMRVIKSGVEIDLILEGTEANGGCDGVEVNLG